MSENQTTDISEILSRYCFFIDAGQMAELAALFAETGEWRSKFGHAVGPAAIEVLLRTLVPAPQPDALRRHFTVNSVIDIAGTVAQAVSYFFVVRSSPRGPALSTVGTYTDTLVKTDAGWRFQSRVLSHDIVGDIGLTR